MNLVLDTHALIWVFTEHTKLSTKTEHMLIAQAIYENLTIITRDSEIVKYPVKTIIA